MEVEEQPSLTEKMMRSCQILERMVTQNSCTEIAEDFKFYEDPADEFKEHEGTLLPLWEFVYPENTRQEVTALAWSTKYPDIFVAGFGSCKIIIIIIIIIVIINPLQMISMPSHGPEA